MSELLVRKLKSIWKCTSREAFPSEWSGIYLTTREILWNEVFLLNWNIQLIERINKPSNFSEKIIFENLYQTSILLIYKLVLDSTENSLTLKKFKNEVIQKLKYEEHRTELASHLKEIAFNKKIGKVASMYRDERHQRVAHLIPQGEGHLIFTRTEITRRELAETNLSKACDIINELYDSIRLNGESTSNLKKSIVTKNFQIKL